MDKKALDGLRLAVVEVRRVTKDYQKSESPSVVLIDRLVDLEKTLLDDFFQAATEKFVKKPAKKPGRSEKHVVSEKLDKSTKPDPLKLGTGTN